MCGIFGVLADELDWAAVERSTGRLRHRGPDDQRVYVSPDRKVGLGACRLSILDLSDAGRQPMVNGDGTLWITYNGEIYNFREIRRELEAYGHQFKSHTDTEVIVHAYEEWGTRCLSVLRGMFAFGIWDGKKNRLFLARDRLGIKPLYYYWDGKNFLFASELKAIEECPGLDVGIDSTALYDFLAYRYIPTPKTPYVKVRKLPPGYYLLFEQGVVSTERYWDVDFGRVEIRDEEEAIENLRAHLEDAIRLHLISDVEIGVFLSGGVDSSCVTAFAAEHLGGQKLRTFSIGFNEPEWNETRYARLVAERYGTQHLEGIVTRDAGREILTDHMRTYDEPFADSSAIPTKAICQLASQYVKTVMAGDGGDEIFGGYNWYTYFFFYRSLRWVPRLLTQSVLKGLRSLPVSVPGKILLSTLAMDPLEAYTTLLGGFTRSEKASVLSRELGDVVKAPRDYDDYWYFRQYWNEDLDLMSRLQYLDLKTYLPDDILTKVDRASMATSLEVRVPLLDHKLVELVASIDPGLRNKCGVKKYLFKKMLRSVLPREIVGRKKQGFSPPLGYWLRSGDFLEDLGPGNTGDNPIACELRPSKVLSIAVLNSWLKRKGIRLNR